MFPSVFPSPPIKILTPGDIPALYELVRQGRHETEDAYFERSFDEQEAQKRVVFVSGEPGHPVGYVHYNRFPKYAMFRRFNIPEIQDLFVHPDVRRRGIGASLLNRCEDQAAKESCKEIGIGVGIISDFGNAQRLYSERGYIPDGAGVVFDREPVKTGEIRPIDDRLCLMLVKQLGRI
jgi:GNAT superfamily N-acetyltransferase